MKKLLSLIAVFFFLFSLASCELFENVETDTDKRDLKAIYDGLFVGVNKDAVTGNLEFKTTVNDVTITYNSRNQEVISNTGVVTRQDEDVLVDVIVTLTYKQDNLEKIASFKVLAKEVREEIISVALGEMSNGTLQLALATSEYKKGSTIVVVVKPNQNYVLDKVFMNGKEANVEVENNVFTFVANENVLLTATFKENASTPAHEHDYQFKAFEWASDNTCKAVLECNVAGCPEQTKKVAATVTSQTKSEATYESAKVVTYTATYGTHTESKDVTVGEPLHYEEDPTVENQITVARALEIINALEDNAKTTETYTITGVISGGIEEYNSQYGNATFNLKDANGTAELVVFRAKLEGNAFTEAEFNQYIKVGNTVTITCQLQKYVKNNVTTPETYNAQVKKSGTTPVDPTPVDPTPTSDYDSLTAAAVGGSGTSYKSWEYEAESGAKYFAVSAFGNNAIQLRSKNDDSALLVVESVGNVKQVLFKVNSNTYGTRNFSVYGYNEVIESIEDFFNQKASLDLIQTFTYIQNSSTLSFTCNVTGSYAYVAVCTEDGAVYFDEIGFVWGEGGDAPAVEETLLDDAVDEFFESYNFKFVLNLTGTGDYTDGYKLTVTTDDGDKYKVVEDYTYDGEKYQDVNYFYYDSEDVLHFVFEDFDDDGNSLGYTDIAETSSSFEYYFGNYTYFNFYDFYTLLDETSLFEKVKANTYKLKDEYVNAMGKAVLGDYDDEGSEYSDYLNGSYYYECTETFTSITVETKNGNISRIIIKTSCTEKYVYHDFDEEEETYSGTQTYTFTFSGYGDQSVTLPDATPYVEEVAISDVFAMSDGDAVYFSEVYVNGFNQAEKVIYICDDNGSIALKYDSVDFNLQVGDILTVYATIQVTGNLYELVATSIQSANEPAEMICIDVDSLASYDYTFVGEAINHKFLEFLSLENGKVNFKDVFGNDIQLVYASADQATVTKLFGNLEAHTFVDVKGLAVSMDANNKFVLKLMDNVSEMDLSNGLSININEITVPLHTTYDQLLELLGLQVYSFENGQRTALEASQYNIDDDYNGEQPNIYTLKITAKDFAATITVTVELVGTTEAFRMENGRGVDYVSKLYNQSYGVKSTGENHILVIPVLFSDYTAYPANYLDLLNKGFNGTSTDTGWESLQSYYLKASNGKLKLIADIMPAYKSNLPYNYSTEDVSDYYDLDQRILAEAIAYYDNEINYKDYDTNEDGRIDTVYLVYLAPYNNTNDDSIFWAYNYNYFGKGEEATYSEYDELTLNCYMWLSINFFNDQLATGVKVNSETVIHETGHALGLDDYYDTNGVTGGFGGGVMMDYNVGDHDAWAKAALGWIDPWIVVGVDAEITINSCEDGGDAIFIAKSFNGSYYSEFFVIEYYTPTGLNELMAGTNGLPTIAGVRILHVNATPKTVLFYDYGMWGIAEASNSTANNRLIYVVEADGGNDILAGNVMSDADLWQANDVCKDLTWADGSAVDFTITVKSIANNQATIVVDYK